MITGDALSTSSFSEIQCSEGLDMQECYWGDTTKEIIAAAMDRQPNGTYAVRNSLSTNGFTLTIRTNEINRLIKIIVSVNKCGFTYDTLDFKNVVELINFYRQNSLVEFNEKLDVKLIYPLPNPNFSLKVKPSPSALKESIEKYEDKISVIVLKCKLEGFHAEYDRASRRYDQIFIQKSSLIEEEKRKKSRVSSYCNALGLFEASTSKLKSIISNHDQLAENDSEAVLSNIQLQMCRIDEISKAKNALMKYVKDLAKLIEENCKELEALKPYLLSLHRKREVCRATLLAIKFFTRAEADRLMKHISLSLDNEPECITDLLLEVQIRWDPSTWLIDCINKEAAIEIISARVMNSKKKDGIFLIRPSKSRPGFFALEISKGSTIHSCLIEYQAHIDGIEQEFGYAFNNTGMYFSTLVDFVHYYSRVPLVEHNMQLDTTLITPALLNNDLKQ